MIEEIEIFERIARLSGGLSLTSGENTSTSTHPFDERNIHSDISKISRKLFDDGHFAQATFEAFKFLDNKVKALSKIKKSGHSLMMEAFSEQSPRIKLTPLVTTSDIDEQMGYKFIFAGSMSAIRNPRGHDNLIDTIDLCLDHLSFASVLLRRLEDALP